MDNNYNNSQMVNRMKEEPRPTVLERVLKTIFVMVELSPLVGLPLAISNRIVNNNKVKDCQKELNVLETNFNNIVSKKSSVTNFKTSKASLYFNDASNDYTLNLFGNTKNTEDNKYKTISFSIKKDDALKIAKAVDERKEYNKFVANITSNFIDPESSLKMVKDYPNFFGKNIEKSASISQEVYKELTNAVLNAYNHSIRDITNVEDFDDNINNCYRSMLDKKDRLNKSTSLLVSGISNVYHDDEKNISFFYVDTLQTKDKINFKKCRAYVSVENSNLTEEETFLKFMNGEIKSFSEIKGIDIVNSTNRVENITL